MILERPEHCKNCHEDYFTTKHIFHCVPRENKKCKICFNPKTKLEEQIREHIKRNGSIIEVEGVFGDTFPNKGFVKEITRDENGQHMIFYGCSIPYNGNLIRETIDSVASVKRTLITTIEYLLQHKFSVFIVSAWRWKKVMLAFLNWFVRIYDADLAGRTYKSLEDFSPVPRELIRAGLELAKEVPLQGFSKGKYETMGRDELRARIYRFFWAFGTFIQFDSAYYWRVQDPLMNLNRRHLLENPRKEIGRLFDIAISREKQIKDKFETFKKAFMLALYFPPLKTRIVRYLSQLDVRAFQPTESDNYYAGRREAYDFCGLSYEERKRYTENIDKERGHIIFTRE